ncbi:MAG: uracil phosphoribosyltransferase [bacterium]|nr:uracil phosphoribosyltransferase [bacterium]
MIKVIRHPVAELELSIIRERSIPSATFRAGIDKITEILMLELIKGARIYNYVLDTVLVPILRAGIFMLPGAIKFLPASKIGLIGLKREVSPQDDKTLVPHTYYVNLPQKLSTVVILDPMLATGGTMVKACEILKGYGANSIYALTIVCAPQGVKLVEKMVPELELLTVSVDKGLDKNGYIVPGIGDVGDRLFGR